LTALREVTIRNTQAQREFLYRAVHDDWRTETLGFGGSRFGGKTYTGSEVMLIRALLYPGTVHLGLRRILAASDMNLGQQIKNHLKTWKLPLGSRLRGQIAYLEKDYEFHFPNGSIIKLGYCKNDNDYEQHVGTQWDTIWIEQAEQFPEMVYDQLKGSNRRSKATECVPRFLLTFNPGGRGSEWLFRRIISERTRDKRSVFVKSVIRECLATLEQDPAYILRSLNKIKDPILRAQWLEGDWDAKSGSYFRLMPDSLKVLTVPAWADWYGGVDWGRDKPFCYLMGAHWQERSDQFGNPGRRHIHIGGEVYSRHLDLDIQARRALEAEQILRRKNPLMHEIEIRQADPSVFNIIESESKDLSRSKADVWAKHGFYVYPSPAYSRVSRWELVRYLLRHGILTIDPEACPNLVMEFKTAIYAKDSEDLDQKKAPDHALDAMAYLICYLFALDYSEEVPQDGYERRDFLRIA
jgi:phage terminase large subunit